MAAPAPSPAGTAPHGAEDFWTQEDRPAAGPIVDAPAMAAAPAPAPIASDDDDALVRVVSLFIYVLAAAVQGGKTKLWAGCVDARNASKRIR